MRELDCELVLDAHADLGEGPTWDEDSGALIWVDINPGLVHRWEPGVGEDTSTAVGQKVGAAVQRAAGGLVLAVQDGFALLDGGDTTMLADVEADNPTTRMNDGKCDRRGRFWAGTMALDKTPGGGALYRFDADRRVERMVDDVTTSNGMDWTLDDRQMYYIDTPTRGVDVFDFDVDTGAIANRRRFVTLPDGVGNPDGMTLDADGCLWVALHRGSAVHRYTPEGTLDCIVRLPVSLVTSCCFGGRDLDRLFITSASTGLSDEQLEGEPHAGGLFACNPGTTGLPPTPFAG